MAGGGVWQSGGAPAADEQGALYFTTGNGMFEPAQENFGDSVLKLSIDGGRLALADFFTPSDPDKRNANDIDLGSGGVLLLPDQPAPHPHLLVAAGKGSEKVTGEGKGGSTIYLLDRDNLGKFHQGDDSQIVQSLPGAIGENSGHFAKDTADNGAFCTPAYFNNRVYYVGTNDVLKAFEVRGGKLSAAPVSQSHQKFPIPGATPSVSANGSSNAIVWVLRMDKFPDFSKPKKPAVLHAYDASDLANELTTAIKLARAISPAWASSSPCRPSPMARSTSAPRAPGRFRTEGRRHRGRGDRLRPPRPLISPGGRCAVPPAGDVLEAGQPAPRRCCTASAPGPHVLEPVRGDAQPDEITGHDTQRGKPSGLQQQQRSVAVARYCGHAACSKDVAVEERGDLGER